MIHKIKKDISESNLLLEEAIIDGDVDKVFLYKDKLNYLIEQGLGIITYNILQDYKGEIDD